MFLHVWHVFIFKKYLQPTILCYHLYPEETSIGQTWISVLAVLWNQRPITVLGSLFCRKWRLRNPVYGMEWRDHATCLRGNFTPKLSTIWFTYSPTTPSYDLSTPVEDVPSDDTFFKSVPHENRCRSWSWNSFGTNLDIEATEDCWNSRDDSELCFWAGWKWVLLLVHYTLWMSPLYSVFSWVLCFEGKFCRLHSTPYKSKSSILLCSGKRFQGMHALII